MSKNQELEELFDTVAELYLKNMEFFSHKYSLIHKKIQDFEKFGKEEYFIDFTNNHFELIDKNNNKIYNCDPFFDSIQRSKNLKHENSFSLLSSKYLENKVQYKNSISASNFINDFLKEKKDSSFTFNKFIFIGTLLAVHLNDIDKELKASTYLIIEDNIEIFRLSLFLCDYESLNQNSKLFFCLNENIKVKENIIESFLSYKYEDNSYIGFELANEFSLNNIEILTKIFVKNDSLNYPFSEYLISLKRGYKYFKESKNGILKLNKKENFLNKRVLFLGSGPSLAENIEWVYMNQDKFIIICAASTLKRCELLDIIPDIILSADGQNKQVIRQYEVNEKYYKNSIIITSIKTDEEVINKINNKNLFFIQDSLELFSEHGIYTGLTVGDTGLKIILNLGAKDIYMLGFDACLAQSGKTHDGMYKTSKVKMKKANIVKNSGFSSSKDLIAVKGNFEKEVLTFMLYVQMIDSINEITSKLDKNTKIYNLSNGAYFNNTKALKIKDFDCNIINNITKTELKNTLLTSLENISKKDLNSKDIQEIKLEIKVLKKLKFIKEDKLDKEFYKLQNTYKSSIVLQILKQFFLLIKPYSKYYNKSSLENKQFKNILKELNIIYNNIL